MRLPLLPPAQLDEVQRNLYASQDALAQSDQAVSSDLVAIYKALGGGWENDDSQSTQPH